MGWAVALSFFVIFVLWCVHFNALDLEFPFGTRINDLPMDEMQQDWNKSLLTLLDKRAVRPPAFAYSPEIHDDPDIVMSDASDLYIPIQEKPGLLVQTSRLRFDKGIAIIKVSDEIPDDIKKRKSTRKPAMPLRSYSKEEEGAEPNDVHASSIGSATAPSASTSSVGSAIGVSDIPVNHIAAPLSAEQGANICTNDTTVATASTPSTMVTQTPNHPDRGATLPPNKEQV